MRILVVSGSYPPMRCGVGDYVGRLVRALRHEALEVSVLTSHASPHADEGAGVLRRMRTWHRRGLDVFHESMRRVDPHVVHIQFPTQGYDAWSGLAGIALLSRLRYRIPIVATLHEFLPKTTFQADRSIYALALVANAIVVVRPEYYARTPWPWKALLRKAKVHFIENASVVPASGIDGGAQQAMKERLGIQGTKLVAFFGFSYPHKGVDQLFEIADPGQHHLLIIGELQQGDTYHDKLRSLAASSQWKGKVTLTGFVEPSEAATLLAAADAVVFPYRTGGGVWNSSLHAATNQGTFTITTSLERNGYDAGTNVYYARPGDVADMRQALLNYQGRRLTRSDHVDPWTRIAQRHKEVYESVAKGRRR